MFDVSNICSRRVLSISHCVLPESEIRSLLNGKVTTAEIELYINSLKVGGNIILFFTLNDGTNNIAWLYLAAVR